MGQLDPQNRTPMSKSNLTFARDPSHPERVVILLDGKFICDMPWQKADECAAALKAQARRAEQYEKAPTLIQPAAMLIRSGAPFALTNDYRIQDAAYTAAQWDPSLRRLPLAAVPSPREVGTPTVLKTPKEES